MTSDFTLDFRASEWVNEIEYTCKFALESMVRNTDNYSKQEAQYIYNKLKNFPLLWKLIKKQTDRQMKLFYLMVLNYAIESGRMAMYRSRPETKNNRGYRTELKKMHKILDFWKDRAEDAMLDRIHKKFH